MALPDARRGEDASPRVAVRSVADELLEDREVAAADQDQLGHGQIAQQLADLAATAPVRANIALYGPWGSGKSGIGNLVRGELKQRKGVGFARFDAFKYAEIPLRRNFISAVATELGVDHPEFHDDLYTGKTTTSFQVPGKAVVRLALIFFGLTFSIALGLLVIVAGVSAVQSGDFRDNLWALSRQALLAALTPAALLSALVVLAGKALGVERKTDKADSGEQFEALFKKLIKRAGKERVVVFVDELDRCGPAEVVATLDAVRTFLGNEGCVFIVAADRQVIEEALTTDVRQATPADPVNPYYSAGSAYLDKVFQYQINVPPLLPASVTRYALELVQPLPGVWAELDDSLPLVVSVLVPSHVRSPRRVKNLLNAFALAYRLAAARQATGNLSTDVCARADEIARMVCLRVEFPLFARDLVRDARLPEYVTRLNQGENEADVWRDHPHATEEVRRLAKDYASYKAPVATLLSAEDQDDPGAQGEDGRHGSERDVESQHGRQLIEYLRRTRPVNGPGRDLLYMQSTGGVVGLDGQLAERLEVGAANGAVVQITEQAKALDEQGREAMLKLLIEQSRTAVGLEARNVAVCLLALSGVSSIDLAARADAVADALAPAVSADPGIVEGAGLRGAWRVGLHSARPTARELRSIVLRSQEAMSDTDVGLMILRDADAALAADPQTTSRLLAGYLISENHSATAQVLLCLAPGTAARLVATASSEIKAALTELLEPPAPAAAARAAGTTAVRAGAPAAAAAAQPAAAAAPASDDAEPIRETLALLLRGFEPGSGGPAQELLGVLLDTNLRAMRDTAEDALPGERSVTDAVLAAKMLQACGWRTIDRWSTWTAPLSPAALRDDAVEEALQNLVNTLWTRAFEDEDRPPLIAIREAAALVAGLLDHRESAARPSMERVVTESLGVPPADSESAQKRLAVLDAVEPLLGAGALHPSVLTRKEADDLPTTLGADLPEQDTEDPLVKYVLRSVPETLSGWGRPGVAAAPPDAESQEEVLSALDGGSWLPEPHATGLPLIARWMVHRGDASADTAQTVPDLPAADAMARLRSEHGSEADLALAAWVRLARPDAQALLQATDEALTSSHDGPVIDAVAESVEALSPADRATFLSGLLADVDRSAMSAAVLRAAGAGSVPDIEVARLLAERFHRCATNVQRQHVLDLWDRTEIGSDAARRLLFERVLIPLFRPKGEGGSGSAIELGLSYLREWPARSPPGRGRPCFEPLSML